MWFFGQIQKLENVPLLFVVLFRSTAGWWANRHKNIDYYSLVQLHAQLVYGDCEFLYGLLAILKAVVLLHKARGELNQNHITQTSQTPEKLYPKDVGQKLPAEEGTQAAWASVGFMVKLFPRNVFFEYRNNIFASKCINTFLIFFRSVYN